MELSTQLQGVFAVAIGLYIAASVGYALLARHGGKVAIRWPFVVLCAAAGFHFWFIGGQCVAGLHPFQSSRMFLNTSGLVVVGGYLGLTQLRRRPMRELGALVALWGMGTCIVGFIAHGGPSMDLAARQSAVLRWHMGLAMLGVSGFALAAGVALMLLVAERRLKSKNLAAGLEGLSVRGLDALHHQLLLATTPVFAASIIFGGVTIALSGAVDTLSSRIFEIAAAGVAFSSCAVSLIGRWRVGLRGRRAAWLTLLGFAFVVLILVSYGVRR